MMLVYKYRSFNEDGLDILLNKILYFSSPDKLNDPLDCLIDIENEFKRFKEETKNRSESHEKNKRIFYINQLESTYFFDTDSSKITLNEMILKFIKDQGILSLSLNPNDPLIWSHYANGHTGFCLGFDVNLIDDKRVYEKEKIRYLSKPLYKEIFESLLNELMKITAPASKKIGQYFFEKHFLQTTDASFFVKSVKWQYEQEFRLISKKIGKLAFHPFALKEIIFGFKASNADIKNILKITSGEEWKHVLFKKARHVLGTFDFELIPLEIE